MSNLLLYSSCLREKKEKEKKVGWMHFLLHSDKVAMRVGTLLVHFFFFFFGTSCTVMIYIYTGGKPAHVFSVNRFEIMNLYYRSSRTLLLLLDIRVIYSPFVVCFATSPKK